MKTTTKQKLITVGTTALVTLSQTQMVFAADGSQVQQKVNNALIIIQGILTGVIVAIGVCVSLWTIIKGMPNMSNPHEKNEVYKSLGSIWALVALGGAIVWLVPWIYSLFQ